MSWSTEVVTVIRLALVGALVLMLPVAVYCIPFMDPYRLDQSQDARFTAQALAYIAADLTMLVLLLRSGGSGWKLPVGALVAFGPLTAVLIAMAIDGYFVS